MSRRSSTPCIGSMKVDRAVRRASLRVLFRAAAGPRLGFGHLVRCGVLADAIGAPRLLSLRGTPAARRRAVEIGWTLVDGGSAAVAGERPALVVVDDPHGPNAAVWVRQARRLGVPVATIHDLGIARVPSDLSIDAGLVHPAAPRPADLQGPSFAILDPRIGRLRAKPARRLRRSVLVSLGGGTIGARLGRRIAQAIAGRTGADVRLTAGFARVRRPSAPRGCRWLDAPRGLAPALARTTVAVLAGGVSLYEACALGTPAVALPIVAAQRPAVRAAGRAGIAVAAAADTDSQLVDRVVAAVERLLDDEPARRALGARARAVVDGRGTARVASALLALAGRAEVSRAA